MAATAQSAIAAFSDNVAITKPAMSAGHPSLHTWLLTVSAAWRYRVRDLLLRTSLPIRVILSRKCRQFVEKYIRNIGVVAVRSGTSLKQAGSTKRCTVLRTNIISRAFPSIRCSLRPLYPGIHSISLRAGGLEVVHPDGASFCFSIFATSSVSAL